MYEVIFSETAIRQFKKLDRSIQKRIIACLNRMKVRPETHVRKLIGDPGYRLLIGDYRLILDIDKKNF
jgi:mRNA interferase RelE/StbE